MLKPLHLHWRHHHLDLSGLWRLGLEALVIAVLVALVVALSDLIGTDPEQTFWMPGVDVMGNVTGTLLLH